MTPVCHQFNLNMCTATYVNDVTSCLHCHANCTFYLCVPQAEELGCEGKVEEAQGVMKLCDQLKEERLQIQNVSVLVSTMIQHFGMIVDTVSACISFATMHMYCGVLLFLI